ncbi:amino acid ABC transporter permease [Motiliproteus sp. MSK22-1]|uniref:amino acid ABC transporter permease n=1 Tax=Motiliproteus sp. MSK22-1 TaxID=1897630 RepID=UPI000978AC13|nr:amino acid ABC transporter permease [Motiliproteus sp. MSK22-1]OMH33651.1 amino acid ABC transporter permease [Motiliproteus sp. MSK22-1]
MPADLDQSSAPASKTKFWNDPDKRAILFQIIIVVLVVGTIGHFVSNALTNLETRGITTGFGFLSQSSGFDILLTLIPYDATYTFGHTFVVGLLNTLLVGFLGVVLATILGFIMGVARLSNNWLISKLAMCYIETFRNIPLLLQIFFWYVAVLGPLPGPRQSIEIGSAFLNNRGLYTPAPVFESGFWFVVVAFFAAIALCWYLVRWNHRRQDLTGQQFPIFWSSVGILIAVPLVVYFFAGSPMSWDYPELKGFNFKGGNVIIPELTALLLALTIYTAAFIAEIVRSGIEAVNKGQTEASHALGISNAKTLRLIVIPQALRVIIPPLTSQYLNLIKNSSLATAIGYPDLVAVFMGTTLNQTGQAIEIIFMTMAVYLTISLLVSAFMNWYNKIMALAER